MILFRRSRPDDLNAIHRLAKHGGVGITTLSKNKDILAQRLEWSCVSFDTHINQPEHEYYLFVLEDTHAGQIIGTSAIDSATGYRSPFYSYKISRRTRYCRSLNIRSDYELLSLVNDNQGRSEICTLFLEPKWRRNGNGLLLSRARFLFMAGFRERFAPVVIAEMRGVSDEQGHSPFWDNVGARFFQMTFAQADALTLSTDKHFIADLMPRNPVYVKLLSPEAQAVIGHPHPGSEAAMNILIKEGFRYNNYVDIFDAGPTLEAPVDNIHTIQTNQMLCIKNISDDVGSASFLIANNRLDFRATIGEAIIDSKNKSCVIGKTVADLLQVKQGDMIRLSLLHPPKTPAANKDF